MKRWLGFLRPLEAPFKVAAGEVVEVDESWLPVIGGRYVCDLTPRPVVRLLGGELLRELAPVASTLAVVACPLCAPLPPAVRMCPACRDRRRIARPTKAPLLAPDADDPFSAYLKGVRHHDHRPH